MLSMAPPSLPAKTTAHGSHGALSVVPSSLPATITISSTGLIVQSYTVINRPLPRQLFVAQPKIRVDDLENSCVFAGIELFHDMTFRKWLNTQTYMRLHAVEPRLLPCGIDQSMPEINAHLLTEDHFFFKQCHGVFWAKDYEKSCKADHKTPGKGKASGKGSGKATDPKPVCRQYESIKALCRKHDRMEYSDISIQLLMQLGCGFFIYEQWIHVISRLFDKISSSDDDDTAVIGHNVQGGHLCHNGKHDSFNCRNVFCMVWDSVMDNNSRRICHSQFLANGNATCVCIPGLCPLQASYTDSIHYN
jgi:hypothetical protein